MKSIFSCLVFAFLLIFPALCGEIPVTGIEQPQLKAFDEAMLSLLERRKADGAVLAIVYDGRLVLARGYGWADKPANRAIEPDGLIRIASISKAISAIALERLIAEGKISLEQNVFQTLLPGVLPSQPADPRMADILVGHLASHTAGLSGDPRCDSAGAIRVVDAAEPPTSHDLLRFFAASMRLQAAPGERYEYSNPGYLMLGRAMESAANESLEALTRRLVFEPLGLHRPRFGRSRIADLSTGETTYPDVGRQRLVRSVFPSDTAPVLITHGGCPMESMEALGGWIASPIELAALFASTPGVSIRVDGSGFVVDRINRNYIFYGHHVEGNGTVIRRIAPGLAFALSFNSSDVVADPFPAANVDFDQTILRLINQTTDWPDVDLLPAYRESWAATFPVTASPDTFAWTTGEGEATSDVLTLRLEGPEGLPFRVNSSALWLRFSARTGVLPAEIEVRVEPNAAVAGTYRSLIYVEHADWFGDPVVIPVQLTVEPRASRPKTLRIRPAGFPPVNVGEEVSLALAAEGGTPPYRWTLLSGTVPDGITIDLASGLISGKPVEEGIFEWVLQVIDSQGLRAERGLSLAVGVPGWNTARLEALAFTSANVSNCDPLGENASSSFPRSTPRITAHLRFQGSVAVGDQAIFEWIAPNGEIRQRNVWTASSGWGPGIWGIGCLLWHFNPAQHSAVSAGEWTVRVTWNRNMLGESKFRLE